MSCGVARTPVFLDEGARFTFLAGVARLVEDGELVVHAFSLTPNHYYLLCTTPRGCLARWMRHVTDDFVRVSNDRRRRMGYLWPGRHKAILVEEGRYLPVCPRYREYVESGKGVDPVSPLERATARLVLGGEQFMGRIQRMVVVRKEGREQPSLTGMDHMRRADPEGIQAVVEKGFPGIPEPGRGRLQLLRQAMRMRSRLGLVEIVRLLGRSPSAVTMAYKSIRSEASRDRVLNLRLHRSAADLGHLRPLSIN